MGYLEGVHNQSYEANEIVATCTYAIAGEATLTAKVVNPNPAGFVVYRDSKGGRADWELRYNDPPVSSTSNQSSETVACTTLAGN